jgi:hypothetical protein
MPDVKWSPDARAALLRDESGEIVGTTWGGTVCWFPRKPRQFAAVERESGDETILRCGFCAGCRELERQWLCQRLCEKYRHVGEDLWLIIVEAPQSLHGFISRSLLRRRKLKLERALYRLGSSSCVFLARGTKPSMSALRGFRFKVTVHRVPKSRGKRAWALLTAGMLKPRDEYGEWTNRYYHRGLPARPREFHFAVSTRGGISRRHATSHYARAWRDGVSIEPPAVWKLPRLNHRKGPERRRPAHAANVDELLAQIFQRAVGDGLEPSSHYRGARSAPASSNDRISNRGRPKGHCALATALAQGGPVPCKSQYRTLNEVKRTGYRGSVQFGAELRRAGIVAQVQMLLKRERADDG